MYGYYIYFNKCIHLLNKINYILSTSLKVLNYFKCTFSYYCSFEPVFLTQLNETFLHFTLMWQLQASLFSPCLSVSGSNFTTFYSTWSTLFCCCFFQIAYIRLLVFQFLFLSNENQKSLLADLLWRTRSTRHLKGRVTTEEHASSITSFFGSPNPYGVFFVFLCSSLSCLRVLINFQIQGWVGYWCVTPLLWSKRALCESH